MSTNLVPLTSHGRGLELTTFDEMWRFADALWQSGMAPKHFKDAKQVLIALQMGAEVGLRPMQSVNSIAVINGRPTLWGDGLMALVRASGECEYVIEEIDGVGETMKATCEAKRRGCPEPTIRSFGYADAKAANLLSRDTYRQYPGRMLQMRARSWCLRDTFADVLCGIVAREEAEDYSDGRLQSGGEAPSEQLDTLTVELAPTLKHQDALQVAIDAMQSPATSDEPPAD